MKKRHWPAAARRELAHYAHLALLEGLFRARRWARAEIAFQGGTSLHLVHGSPRFSEDIDLILDPALSAAPLMRTAVRHLRDRLALDFPQWTLEVTSREKEGEPDDPRNPRLFDVRIASPLFHEAVHVKTEFWVPPPGALAYYDTAVGQAGPAALPSLNVRLMPVTVQAASLEAIFRDKLLALAARPYLKYRDVFDLWWLRTATALKERALAELVAALPAHLALYPTGLMPAELPAALRATAAKLREGEQRARAEADLPQWFDAATASLYGREVANMVSETAGLLEQAAAQFERAPEPAPRPKRGRAPRT